MSEQLRKICELAEQVQLALLTSEIERATENNTKSAVLQKNATIEFAHAEVALKKLTLMRLVTGS